MCVDILLSLLVEFYKGGILELFVLTNQISVVVTTIHYSLKLIIFTQWLLVTIYYYQECIRESTQQHTQSIAPRCARTTSLAVVC